MTLATGGSCIRRAPADGGIADGPKGVVWRKEPAHPVGQLKIEG